MAEKIDQDVAQLKKKMNGKKAQIQRLPTITARQRSDFNQEIQEFQEQIDDLNAQIQKYEQTNGDYKQKHIQQLKQEFQGFVSLKKELESLIKGETIQQQQQALMGNKMQPKTFQGAYAPPEASNQQVYKGFQQQKKETDDKIDSLNDQTVKIKHVAVQIGEVLDDQNVKLDELDQRIDNNQNVMIRTTQKMKKLINESSSWRILLTIFVEIAILALILIYLS